MRFFNTYIPHLRIKLFDVEFYRKYIFISVIRFCQYVVLSAVTAMGSYLSL